MNLTDSQKRAIEHRDGNLQLIACAGSGKTEVVARFVSRLLSPATEPRLGPANIVAFTFTDKAATELKERIITRCNKENGEMVGLAELYSGTIHGFCLDLLKSEIPRFLKFEVLNEVRQTLFADRHSKQSGLTLSTDLGGKNLKRFTDTGLYISALSILREAELNDGALRDNSLVAGLASWKKLLSDRAYFDYSAIIEEAVMALRDDEGLRKRMAERLRYVIVDEYQDVNPIQECVVRLLHDLGAKVCVVGDDDQTIYQWRGGDVGNILNFEGRYPRTSQIRLEENFRSSRGIVEIARDFIGQNEERLPKAMKSASSQPWESGDIVALAFENPDEEAKHIASSLASLRGIAFSEDGGERGLAWSDMAILLRSVKNAGEPITRALAEAGIPFVIGGMNNLFSRPEAEAARQLFYFIRERIDEGTLVEAWKAAGLGVSDEGIAKAIAGARLTKFALGEADEKRWVLYSLQRQFLGFIEDLGLREENVPEGRGEVVLYNLGKFSQLISDFEAIHFHSKPDEKYEAFCGFLQYNVERAYPEGWQDNHYANPDAVRVMTVHQAKGMQWPVVFIPGLIKNRFPSRKMGGRSVWHLLPREAVVGQARYEGSIEDERRLFYVALTRAQKFLHLSWAPIPGNPQAQKVSEFWENTLASKWVKRRSQDYGSRRRLSPSPRASVANVAMSFSELKYFFECPYQFKLRILYGFNAPIHEALGYGKSLHDCLHEVHSRALRGELPAEADVAGLVDTHLHLPFSYPALRDTLEASARRVVSDYIRDNREDFDKIEFSEKGIEINLGDGVTVKGRIDLVRRLDTGETTIVDLKSNDRAQAENVTETQLHIYALGYRELTGRDADFVEIYDLDGRKRKPRSVDEDFIADVKTDVRRAAEALRRGRLDRKPGVKRCATCDYQRLCGAGKTSK
ncbi:MAG: ATP-dependent DNA helicase [Treponema sp.]|nr:ATP-dependent DNA helicase [Treponema sp.]